MANAIERVILVKDGRILADGDKREILRSELVSELFGLPLTQRGDGGIYRALA